MVRRSPLRYLLCLFAVAAWQPIMALATSPADELIATVPPLPEDLNQDVSTSGLLADEPSVRFIMEPLRMAQVPVPSVSPVAPRPSAPQGTSTIQQDSPGAFSQRAEPDTQRLNPSILDPIIREGRSSRQLWSPGTDYVEGTESILRRTRDVGNLVHQSRASNGIAAQQRNAVTSDIRIRGFRAGQNIGAGSYWNPGRPDLDTALNKIFSNNVESLLIIKGPYSVRYGPGFNVVDMELMSSPRFSQPSWQGTTSVNYETNGEVFYGREHLWGGGTDWGVRANYGHGTGNDYVDGVDFLIPNSFKSRDLLISVGRDLSPDSTLEFSYLRLDQTDVEFPGLVYDLNWLVTDGFELEYLSRSPGFADSFRAEAWYNRTRFEGDTLRPSKNRQIPSLREVLYSPDGSSGYAITDVDGSSIGYRLDWTWEERDFAVTVGTDLIYLDNTLNDIEPLRSPDDNNFPVPHSNSADVGLFADYTESVNQAFTVSFGTRLDFIRTRSSEYVAGVPGLISDELLADLDQTFTLWGGYVLAEYECDEHLIVDAGLGMARRPPSLVEMYSNSAFIGTLQRGLTYLLGDPELDAETLRQVDIGCRWEYGAFRGRTSAYYAWVDDYITYDLTSSDPGGLAGLALVNTDLAILTGIEMAAEYQVAPAWGLFSKMFFTEGRDLGRNKPARTFGYPRSGIAGRASEPLPGIAPLEAQLGIRWMDPTPSGRWSVELLARVVDNQDRIAASLEEIATPGFTTWNVHSFCQVTDRVMLVAGVRNFTDKFYREHLDYLSGLGVYQKGTNFYFGTDVSY